MQSAHAAAADPQIVLDPQRLDCYRVTIEFVALSRTLITRGHGDLRSQLSRAASSAALNLAEGVGRRATAEKAHFFAIARGSAMECGAILDIVRSLGLAPADRCKEAQWHLARIVQMLTKLEVVRVMGR